MTTPTMLAEVVDNGDGTYTIPDPDGGDWTIFDTGEGWTGEHPKDSWVGVSFATPADIAHAILGDPAPCRLSDGRTYGEVYG